MEVQQGAPLVYVSFSAEINPNTSESLISTMSNLINLQVKEVYILLSTPGGQVMNGMTLYNFLKGMPCELTIHNIGNVDSIGNAIFLAGKKRYATSNATFMFHGVGFNSPQNQRLEEKLLREKLGSILSDQKRIGDIITQNTNVPTKKVAKLFREAQTKDASWAFDNGIIHEVREIQFTSGCPVISLVFKRQSI